MLVESHWQQRQERGDELLAETHRPFLSLLGSPVAVTQIQRQGRRGVKGEGLCFVHRGWPHRQQL